MRQTQYPDTASGAISCLEDESYGLDLKNAKVYPDPVVEGVWEVRMRDGRRAIVWLAGYKDPLGKVRVYNDFEVEE